MSWKICFRGETGPAEFGLEMVQAACQEYLGYQPMTSDSISLSEADDLILLACRNGNACQNKELDAVLCGVFSRALPRLLTDETETQYWVPVAESIDLRDAFGQTVQQLRANAKAGQKPLEEAFILSLIRLGNTLVPLRPAAAEQAISIIE